jgi:hypothetical protein
VTGCIFFACQCYSVGSVRGCAGIGACDGVRALALAQCAAVVAVRNLLRARGIRVLHVTCPV